MEGIAVHETPGMPVETHIDVVDGREVVGKLIRWWETDLRRYDVVELADGTRATIRRPKGE